MMMMEGKQGLRLTTLCFCLREGGKHLLLGRKKRGFGLGKWNGLGGKVEASETIVAAAKRECEEESGLVVEESHLEKRGLLEFIFEGNPEWDNRCHVFVTSQWKGDPVETDEMAPQWWDVGSLPYDKMWPDDKIWYKQLTFAFSVYFVFPALVLTTSFLLLLSSFLSYHPENALRCDTTERVPIMLSGQRFAFRFFFRQETMLRYETITME
ncbi:Oxidized purine nucleoside triphosphate hydrolase [Balamuthia mandrillaris]